jgi:hypothetical protein
MLKNFIFVICWPITTRQTVRGVESKRPMGPQSHVQKIAAKIRANDETYGPKIGLDLALLGH